MEIFNLFTGATDIGPEGNEPPGYEQTTAARVGRKLGATRLGMTVYDLPPGRRSARTTSSGPTRNGCS